MTIAKIIDRDLEAVLESFGFLRVDQSEGKNIIAHRTHKAKKMFPESNECWRPGSKAKPNWRRSILRVEARLAIPARCQASIRTKTILRDIVPGGATEWAEAVRFGVSDGTDTGGLQRATRVTEKTIEFTRTIRWDKSCTIDSDSDLFVYVKFPASGKHSFIEVRYYPRIASLRSASVDKSPNPVIRLNPCNNVKPIRRPYRPGKWSERYWRLSERERGIVNREVNLNFRRETLVTRSLNFNNPEDRPLVRHWLRIRDKVMAK